MPDIQEVASGAYSVATDIRTHALGAVAVAAKAATTLPYAWPIVGFMLMAIADPDAQDRGAEQWLNPNSVITWPTANNAGSPFIGPPVQQEWHPPMAASPAARQDGSSDIAYLRSELNRLGREIGQSGDWEGRAYTSFMEKINELDGHLEALDRNRAGTGDTLKCTATGCRVLMYTFLVIAGILVTLQWFVIWSQTHPLTGQAAHIQAMRAVAQMSEKLSTWVTNHRTLMTTATLSLMGAAVLYNQFAKDLPGLQAVSASTPNLMEASAMWDPTTANIVDSPQSQFNPGQFDMGPEFGF
ncbi:hypothetical protein ACFOY2_51185 [Nonomuraea purpurea]|uniref:WXG100 family type VII secretion target n=1 Tax=Nonomuraea purpurea TaxID=1849276 RepID=A0ABV8GSG4_9ACTN